MQSESCCHTSTSDSSSLQHFFLPRRVGLVSELTLLDPFFHHLWIFPTPYSVPTAGESTIRPEYCRLIVIDVATDCCAVPVPSRRGGAGRVCSLTVVAIIYTSTTGTTHTAVRYDNSFDLTHHHHCSIFFYPCRTPSRLRCPSSYPLGWGPRGVRLIKKYRTVSTVVSF